MNFDPATLPDDYTQLKQMLVSLRDHHNKETSILLEQISLLRAQLYGRTSEKTPTAGGPQPLPLFDMPEPTGDEEPLEEQQISVPAHHRKKSGRKPLPLELPRVEVVHDIGESEKTCQCGQELSRIGEETSEQLDIIPATVRVIKHIRPKYACRRCEGIEDDGPTVKIAPVEPQLIPKSIATAGLIGPYPDRQVYRPHAVLSAGTAVPPPWCGHLSDIYVQLGHAGRGSLPATAESADRRDSGRRGRHY